MFEPTSVSVLLFVILYVVSSFLFGAGVSLTRQSWGGGFFGFLLALVFTAMFLVFVGLFAVCVITMAEEALHYRFWFTTAVSVVVWLAATILGFLKAKKIR